MIYLNISKGTPYRHEEQEKFHGYLCHDYVSGFIWLIGKQRICVYVVLLD